MGDEAVLQGRAQRPCKGHQVRAREADADLGRQAILQSVGRRKGTNDPCSLKEM